MTNVHWALSADSKRPVDWDPVNLVFWGEASAQLVAKRLKEDFGLLWSDTGALSGKLFAFTGGTSGVPQDADIAFGSLDLRYHLRLYDVPYSAADPLGDWCIGGVHLEHLQLDWARLRLQHLRRELARRGPNISVRDLRALWTHACPLTHKVTTWKEPQLVAEALFEGHERTTSVDRRRLQNGITYQQTNTEPGVPFDGLATFIELRR
jgi:hypothetical protein